MVRPHSWNTLCQFWEVSHSSSHPPSLAVHHSVILHWPTQSARHVQYNTVRYSTLHCSTVHCSTVQYSTVQYSTLQYSTLQYTTLQYSTLQYSRGESSVSVDWPFCIFAPQFNFATITIITITALSFGLYLITYHLIIHHLNFFLHFFSFYFYMPFVRMFLFFIFYFLVYMSIILFYFVDALVLLSSPLLSFPFLCSSLHSYSSTTRHDTRWWFNMI